MAASAWVWSRISLPRCKMSRLPGLRAYADNHAPDAGRVVLIGCRPTAHPAHLRGEVWRAKVRAVQTHAHLHPLRRCLTRLLPAAHMRRRRHGAVVPRP